MHSVRWLVDTSVSGYALLAAFILAGLTSGIFASRWNAPRNDRPGDERLLLAAAALVVVAWFANAGSLIGGATSNRLLTAHVPINVETGYRLAVLWTTVPGATLSFAMALLVRAALARRPDRTQCARYVATLAVVALIALGAAVWFAPSPNASATSIPPFVQSSSAALAPLLALSALILLADVIATRVAGARPEPLLLRLAWVLATTALAAEQVARSRLGIGPRDAILLGSASSGLVLWLVASALLHARVRTFVFRIPSDATRSSAATLTAHIGATLLAISFALHGFAARTTLSIPPGASVDVADSFSRTWRLANQGVSRFDAEDADVLSVALEATKPSGATTLLTPEIREYHGRNGEHLDNPIARRQSTGAFAQTLRVLLVGADSLDVASVRVTFLPAPILWPVGLFLLALSVFARRGATLNEPRIE